VRSSAATVTVNAAAVPVITITAKPAATTTVTQGSIAGSLSVSATVTLGATLSYQWYSNSTAGNAGGALISGATGASFAIPATLTQGTYYYFCEVRATGGAASVRSSAATVTVNAAETVTVSGTVSGVPAGTEVQLYVAPPGATRADIPGGYVYVSSAATNGAGYYSFGQLPPGTYIVLVVMNGANSAPSQPVTLAGGETATGVNFTARDGIVTPDGITGTGEMFAPNLKIYPNPFTDAVRITGGGTAVGAAGAVGANNYSPLQIQIQLRITNAAGAVVHIQPITAEDETIRLEHLPQGVYFFTFEREKQSKTVKIVKN
jgi:hypothetical protein